MGKPPALPEDAPSSRFPGMVRYRVVSLAVPPHPDPLPQGEGTARIAQSKADGFALFSAERTVHPLPKGEGWGEGKEHTAPRGADVLALAYGQCPQHSMDLSHSRFQVSGVSGGR